MDFDKCILSCIHHYSIIQNSFTALKKALGSTYSSLDNGFFKVQILPYHSPHSASPGSTLFLVFCLQSYRSFCFISSNHTPCCLRVLLMLFLPEILLSTSWLHPQVLSWFVIMFCDYWMGLLLDSELLTGKAVPLQPQYLAHSRYVINIC